MLSNAANRVNKYKPFLKELKFDVNDMSMKLINIENFERANVGLAINVLSYMNKTENTNIKHPLFSLIRRTNFKNIKPIYLLFLEENNKCHNILVKNLQRLLNGRKNNNCEKQICYIWCSYCLNRYRLQKSFKKHQTVCSNYQIKNNLPNDELL